MFVMKLRETRGFLRSKKGRDDIMSGTISHKQGRAPRVGLVRLYWTRLPANTGFGLKNVSMKDGRQASFKFVEECLVSSDMKLKESPLVMFGWVMTLCFTHKVAKTQAMQPKNQ